MRRVDNACMDICNGTEETTTVNKLWREDGTLSSLTRFPLSVSCQQTAVFVFVCKCLQ